MAVGDIFTVPDDPDAFQDWSFVHAAHHYDIQRAVFEQKAVRLDNWVLNPFDRENPGIWTYLHQTMHNQANKALGTEGQNLTDVDWTDSDSLSDWINANAIEHQRFAQILGIG